jgi:hypothetical protein
VAARGAVARSAVGVRVRLRAVSARDELAVGGRSVVVAASGLGADAGGGSGAGAACASAGCASSGCVSSGGTLAVASLAAGGDSAGVCDSVA